MAELTASNTLIQKYQVTMRAGRHEMIADEPESYGGDDTGPSPFEYLLGSLAACTAMTVRMYAQRKEWPLEKIDMTLSHQKISAEACDNCLTTEGKIDLIKIDIAFEGDLDAKQLERLKYIAGRCPVHKALVTETKIEINA